MSIKELPLRERPREKMLYSGKESLSDSELLALLLGSGANGLTAVQLGQQLLKKDHGGLVGLEQCLPEELATMPGIGIAKATRVVAALELGKRLATMPRQEKVYIRTSSDAAQVFAEKMRYYTKEVFAVLLLDTKGGLLGFETIAMGDLSSSIVHPRESFRDAIRRGAYAVIFVHNHPSGDPTPSQEDKKTTERLVAAGKILGIPVMDHLIIGDGRFVSLKEKGVIT